MKREICWGEGLKKSLNKSNTREVTSTRSQAGNLSREELIADQAFITKGNTVNNQKIMIMPFVMEVAQHYRRS